MFDRATKNSVCSAARHPTAVVLARLNHIRLSSCMLLLGHISPPSCQVVNSHHHQGHITSSAGQFRGVQVSIVGCLGLQ